MRTRAWITATAMAIAGMLCVVMVEAQAQQPKVTHAQMSVKAGDNLQREISAVPTTTWIGYLVAATHRINSDWGDNVIHLEGNGGSFGYYQQPADAPIPPAVILLRVANGKVVRMETVQNDREIDAGGLPFVWLTDVSPADSVKTLKNLIEQNIQEAEKLTAASVTPPSTGDRERDRILRDVQHQEERVPVRIWEHGMTALTLHAAPEATAALISFTVPSYSATVRDKAAFWLANERGAEGYKTVSAMLKNDKDDALRAKLVFDLSLVKGDSRKAAIDDLIAAAKTDTAPNVRKQAQFWLAQMAGKNGGDSRIVVTLGESAQNDPEAGIRKSAVFALSRLPADQAVPELIQVASTTKDAATRREAIFWLGQSKDPRALDYLVKVVKGN